MKKNNIVRSVCVILAVIMFTGSVTAAKKKNGCDECDPKYKGPTYLELKVAHPGLDLRDDLFYVSAQLPGHWLAQMPEFGEWN